MNGIVKVPMQFMILLIGALLFAFYSYQAAPVNFNEGAYAQLQREQPEYVSSVEARNTALQQKQQQQANAIVIYRRNGYKDAINPEVGNLKQTQKEIATLRSEVQQRISSYTSDNNYTN